MAKLQEITVMFECRWFEDDFLIHTYLAHNGETVTVAHNDPLAEMEAARQEAFHRWFEKLSKEEQDSWLLTNGS